jgi:hypothetical protein
LGLGFIPLLGEKPRLLGLGLAGLEQLNNMLDSPELVTIPAAVAREHLWALWLFVKLYQTK